MSFFELRAISVFTCTALAGIALGQFSNASLGNSFELATDLQRPAVTTILGTTVEQSNLGVIHGLSSMRINYPATGPATWPSATVRLNMANLTLYSGVGVDLHNPGTGTINMGIRMQDINGRASTTLVTLAPGESRAVFISNDPTAFSGEALGMKEVPTPFYQMDNFYPSVNAGFDFTRVDFMQFYIRDSLVPASLCVDGIRYLWKYDSLQLLNRAVDPLGQYSRAQWPGKASSSSDIRAQRATEDLALAAAQPVANRSLYGGSMELPKTTTFPHFRTGKTTSGKWYFIDPSGSYFWSLGVNSVSTDEYYTLVTGREAFFQWLPAPTDGLSRHFLTQPDGKRFYSHYRMSLERKFGNPTWESSFVSTTRARFRQWGLNTFGNWSQASVEIGSGTPYTTRLSASPRNNTLSSGNDLWGPLPDPFEAAWKTAVNENFAWNSRDDRVDPFCIGYFVDNEMSWRGRGALADVSVALNALSRTATFCPAKRAIITWLQARYATLADLNTAWGTTFTTWEGLNAPYTPAATVPQAQMTDFRGMMTLIAEEYFRTVAEAIQRHAPNKLYLGCRFGNARFTPEVLAAAARWADVLSFNVYRSRLAEWDWSLLEGIDKPILISEFHVGTFDRGTWYQGLVPGKSEARRGPMVERFIRDCLEDPRIVGVHWYKYVDQPILGSRTDIGNGGIGLVDVTDRPYPVLTSTLRSISEQMYIIRGN